MVASQKEILSNVSNLGLGEKKIYSEQQGNIHLVKDAGLGLLLPGRNMVVRTFIHWGSYKAVVVNSEFREGNLVMRSHSIVFTIVVVLVVS